MGHAFGILMAHVGTLQSLRSFRRPLPWALGHYKFSMKQALSLIAASAFGGIIGALSVTHMQAAIATPNAALEPRSIAVSEVRIVDKAGNTKILIGAPEGSPSIFLYDESGDPQAHIGVTNEGPRFYLANKGQAANISMFADDKGARMGVDDKSGFVAINIASNKPGITVHSNVSKATLKLSAEK